MPVILSASDIRSQMAAENDGDLAEPIRLLPQTGGASDATRGVFEFYGLLRVGQVGPERIGESYKWESWIEAGKARLAVARDGYQGPELRQGDLIVALARSGEPVWRIETLNDRHYSRIICELSEAS
ncbi:hypothetical protein [Cohaesibacter marisflavi]|uniref:hypothetical protein n=1 Tax=Cohaesibacter marisflavi TaxID=655353 RepID=UPI0029C8D8A0|nr:hypothetical protein [Cohaesibacter marisflavi]